MSREQVSIKIGEVEKPLKLFVNTQDLTDIQNLHGDVALVGMAEMLAAGIQKQCTQKVTHEILKEIVGEANEAPRFVPEGILDKITCDFVVINKSCVLTCGDGNPVAENAMVQIFNSIQHFNEVFAGKRVAIFSIGKQEHHPDADCIFVRYFELAQGQDVTEPFIDEAYRR